MRACVAHAGNNFGETHVRDKMLTETNVLQILLFNFYRSKQLVSYILGVLLHMLINFLSNLIMS